MGYLSEVERGQKEASSELLASICGALGVPLSQVLREVSDQLALAELQEAALSGSVPADSAAGPDRLGIDSTIPDRVPEVVDMVGCRPRPREAERVDRGAHSRPFALPPRSAFPGFSRQV